MKDVMCPIYQKECFREKCAAYRHKKGEHYDGERWVWGKCEVLKVFLPAPPKYVGDREWLI